MLDQPPQKKLRKSPVVPVTKDLPYQPLSRPPSVPILRRRASGESILKAKNRSASKSPHQINSSRKKRKKNQTALKLVPKLQLFKTKLNSEDKRRKSPNTNSRFKESKTSRNLSPGRPFKTPENHNNINEIIQKSLKEHKSQKKLKEKNEKLKSELKIKLKNAIKEMNICTREENLKKVKVLQSRFPLGKDNKKSSKKKQKNEEFSWKKKKKFKESNSTPEVSPGKGLVLNRKSVRTSRKINLKKEEKKTEKKQKDLKINKLKKTKKTGRKIKKFKDVRWLDKYLEDLTEISNKPGEFKMISNAKFPSFGIVDDFELFDKENPNIRSENQLKINEGVSKPEKNQVSSMSDSDSQEIFLEKKSKILDLKKQNKEKNREIKEKIKKTRFKIEENYFNDKFTLLLQSLSKGWLIRNTEIFKSENQPNQDKEASNSSNSWLFKKQYPEESESSINDEEANQIIRAFKISSNKIKRFKEKSKNFESKSNRKKLEQNREIENPKDCPEKTGLISEPKSFPESPLYANTKKNQAPREPFLDIISLDPVCDGQNLNINELSDRIQDESQNLDLLENESIKIKESLMNSFKYTRPDQTDFLKEEPLKIFNEKVQEKHFTGLGKNFNDPTGALADSLRSKSDLERLEFSKKLKKMPNEERSKDMEGLLKDLIRSQNSDLTENKCLDRLEKRSSLDPDVFLKSAIIQNTSYLDLGIDELLDLGLSIEQLVLGSLIIDSLDEYLLNLTECLLNDLVLTELALIQEEHHHAFTEESLEDFVVKVFEKFGESAIKVLASIPPEDSAKILALMQESEIGSGHFQDALLPVIAPEAFLDVVGDGSLHICIYKKMVFDCINEFLNCFAPEKGALWHRGERKTLRKDQVFCECFRKILEAFRARLGNIWVGEIELVGKIREERMDREIRKEDRQADCKWVDYGFEEDQVKLDLADMVLEILVEESISF